MKILFLTDNFPPEMNAPATRTMEHCREWVRSGVEVTVITCVPNFPGGKVFAGYKNKFVQKEFVDGVTVIRVWSYISANEGIVKRTIDYISFSIMSFLIGLFQKTDIVIATSPQFFTVISGYALSLFKRKPWIFELRDLWPESIKAVGVFDNKTILSILEKMEMFLYRKSNIIISVTDSFKTNLISRGIEQSKIKVINNGVDLSVYKPQSKDIDLLTKLGLKDKFIVSYIGTHGLAHGLEFIINSIREVKEEIHFLFVGGGATKEKLVDLAKKLKLYNCTFIDFVQKDHIIKYLSISDVALINLKKSDTFKTVIPSKIFENAAMNIPILLGVEGEAAEIITRYKSGECFEPENKNDFLEKLEFMNKIIIDGSETYKVGLQEISIEYDRNKLASKMLDVIKMVIKSNKVKCK